MPEKISAKTLRRLEEGFRNWDNVNSPARKRYEASRAKRDKEIKKLKEAIDNSERITAEDLNIMVY